MRVNSLQPCMAPICVTRKHISRRVALCLGTGQLLTAVLEYGVGRFRVRSISLKNLGHFTRQIMHFIDTFFAFCAFVHNIRVTRLSQFDAQKHECTNAHRGAWPITIFVFTARRVCIARTMPCQDVCMSVRLSVTHRYCA